MTSLETYLKQLRQERAAAVNETSFYAALRELFNSVGDTLKPKIRYIITPKGQGAGIPDGGLYAATQLRRDAEASPATTLPERGRGCDDGSAAMCFDILLTSLRSLPKSTKSATCSGASPPSSCSNPPLMKTTTPLSVKLTNGPRPLETPPCSVRRSQIFVAVRGGVCATLSAASTVYVLVYAGAVSASPNVRVAYSEAV